MDRPGIFLQAKLQSFLHFVRTPWKAFFFLAARLPAAWLAGVRMESISPTECMTSVPFRWLSQNPFRSTYFACLAMAAELSNGLLAMLYVQAAPRRVSMLVVKMEASFHKKAVTRTLFQCADGQRIADAIASTLATGDPVTLETTADGHSPDGTHIASFKITWSFKASDKK